jgi:hypothetical protein
MCARILTSCAFSVALAAGLAVGCKEAKQSVKSDPHSPQAAMRAIMEQGDLLNDAMKRKDFQFIHDNMYYLQSLAKALYGKLEAEQKERLKARFDELTSVTDELDHAAGRRHGEATQATMKRLLELLKDLDGQFRTEKSTRTIPQR